MVECSVCFSPDITRDSASHKYPVATRVRSMPEHSRVFHTFDTHIRGITNGLTGVSLSLPGTLYTFVVS